MKALLAFFFCWCSLNLANTCDFFQDVKWIDPKWKTGRNGQMRVHAKAYDIITFHLSTPINDLHIHYGLTNFVKLNPKKYQYRVVQWPDKYSNGIKFQYTMKYQGSNFAEITQVEVSGKFCNKNTKPTHNPTRPTHNPTKNVNPTKKPQVTTHTKPSGGCTPRYDYKLAIKYSLLFYEAQRSGKLPSNNRIPWRRSSCLRDGSKVGLDLTGGYYDAGDYVKFMFPQTFAITLLAWGMVEYPDGYKFAGEYQHGLDAIRWGTDFLIKCHSAPNKFWGQIGNGVIDHRSWGRETEIDESQRWCYELSPSKPGSEVSAEAAAALAASAIVFKTIDPAYSGKLLYHAKQLYNFASTHRGDYHNAIPDVKQFYRSFSGYYDELAWAATWLYDATKDRNYLNKAQSIQLQQHGGFSWDNKWEGANVLLAKLTGDQKYKNNARGFCERIKNHSPRTPKHKGPNGKGDGLVFISKWGSNRHAANVAFLCMVHSKYDHAVDYLPFARGQLHMMLGDAGRSYVVGYGKNPPQRCHHGGASCPNRPAGCGWGNFHNPGPNPQILYGALVGGPKNAGGWYEDKRSDYVANEVAVDYNAGFQSALAGVLSAQMRNKC